VPYRRRGRVVEKKTASGWTRVPGGVHKTVEEAQKHLIALRINVEEKGPEKGERHG
jgi:hypothetical protein